LIEKRRKKGDGQKTSSPGAPKHVKMHYRDKICKNKKF
jgi:hypothetical protein